MVRNFSLVLTSKSLILSLGAFRSVLHVLQYLSYRLKDIVLKAAALTACAPVWFPIFLHLINNVCVSVLGMLCPEVR